MNEEFGYFRIESDDFRIEPEISEPDGTWHILLPLRLRLSTVDHLRKRVGVWIQHNPT